VAGFIQDPMQFVNLIRDNLSDRYQSGFPVLKELIQNTDDAKATQLDFGLIEGIPEADHPLLKGPGLFFINNGKFQESDARGIFSFGLNSKADDNSSIGKFGLGMKSVFHFCEAFFYLATDGDKDYQEILNPWSGPNPDESLHADWDQFSDGDADRLRNRLASILNNDQQTDASFILLLPLRMRKHLKQADGIEAGAIVPEYAGDDSAHLAFLQARDLAADIARLLPMLGHLREVRFWDLRQQASGPEFSIQLAEKEVRRQLLAQIEKTGDQKPNSPHAIKGRVKYLTQTQDSETLDFTGLEGFGWNPALEEMHDHELWPASNVRDQHGQSKSVKDKARPHGAALFSRQPGNGKLTTQWAVFLPLQEQASETILCKGNHDFQLLLHGYFFIDAGRQGIDGQKSFAVSRPQTFDNDRSLKTAWNVELARQQVLPLVLPALAEFCRTTRLSDALQTELTSAFSATRIWRELGSAISQGRAWLRTLDAEGIAWRLHEDARRVRLLPEPPTQDAHRPWQVFPDLLGKDDSPVYVSDSSPRLLDPTINTQWQETELLAIYQALNVKAVFADTTRLDYLVRFCADTAGPHQAQGSVQSALRDLLKAAFTQVGEKTLQQNRKLIQAFIECLSEGSCLRLENSLPPLLLKQLLEADTDVLPIPSQFLSSENRVAKNIAVDDAISLLKKLDAAVVAAKGNSELHELTLKVAERVFNSVSLDSRSQLIIRCADLAVLSAYDCRQSGPVAVSPKQIQQAKDDHLLFGYAQGTTFKERRGFADAFQNVLAQKTVLLANREICNLVLQQPMKPCRGDVVLSSLGRKAHELTGPQNRASLASLVGAPADDVAIRGLRYLLHAKPEYFEATDTLWLLGYQQDPVWQKIWEQIQEVKDFSWNLIDNVVAENISRGVLSSIRVSEIRADEIQREILEHELAPILDAGEFTQAECARLLKDIQDDDLWQALPFHWSCHGYPVSADGDDIYLSSEVSLDALLLQNIDLVIPSQDSGELRRQKRLLKGLDEIGMLGVLLAAPTPEIYWTEILDVLAENTTALDIDMRGRLRRTKWIPTQTGAAVCPENIVDIAEHLDELSRLQSLDPGSFCLPNQLLQALQDHQAYAGHCRALFSHDEEGLGKIRGILANQPAYHVGLLSIGRPEEMMQLTSVLGKSSHSGWQLLLRLTEIFEPYVLFDYIWPAMRRSISLSGQFEFLSWLADSELTDKSEVDAYNVYLLAFSKEQGAGEHLQNLRLLSRNQKWVAAESLVSGVEGIAPAHVLDDQQASILRQMIFAGARPEDRVPRDTDFQTATMPGATGKLVSDYFETWYGRVPDPLIAALIVLLGREESAREVAAEYLGHHSLDWLIDQVPWVVPETSPGEENRTWLHGLGFEEALAHFKVAVVIQGEKEVLIESIIGEQIKVELDSNFETLFIGRPSYHSQGSEGYLVKCVLRKIEPTDYADSDLADYIKLSVRYLLKELYNQQKPLLDGLWSELDKSDQVDIGLARALILEHIPFYLKQLGAHKHPDLDRYLRGYDEARKKVAEFKGKAREQELRARQETLLVEVQQLIETNHSIQDSILNAIRTKVRDYQYQSWSIPFEVFQNADDAVQNLEEIEAWPSAPGALDVAPLPAELLKFVVDIEPGRVTFMHWGRAINQVGNGSFPGKERKYDNDLENMVILSASDKGDDVTGKFGLGFKSVLLVADAPEIVSGRLQTKVVGGLLPTLLLDSSGIQGKLNAHQTQRQRGTAISLPLREGVDPAFLDPFLARVGVLVAFSKKINNVEINQPDGTSLSAIWSPTDLGNLSGCAVGRVQLGPGKSQLVLKLDLGEGAILIALDESGFCELPVDLPSIWVTAPISESDQLGYAINGKFEIDAGRSRLAANSNLNDELGSALGIQLESHLELLLSLDWQALRQQLMVSDGVTEYEFWYGLWRVLLSRLPRIARDSGVRVIAQSAVVAGLGRLAGNHEFVPNGLPGRLGHLLKWQEVRFVFRGLLAQPQILHALGETALFDATLETNKSISEEVSTWLRLVSPEFSSVTDQWVSLGFCDLLASLSGQVQITASDTSVLGRVLNQETRDLLLEGGKAALDDFDNSIDDLNDLKFQSSAGDWYCASELLTTSGSEDEKRRCQFAPATRLLASGYDDSAVDFFLLCRGGMEASAERLVSWLLEAETELSQKAALRYLLEGELGPAVARHLLETGLPGTWVAGVDDESNLLADWEYADKRELLYKILISSKEIKNILREGNGDDDAIEAIEPAIALNNIYQWWEREKEEYLEEYLQSTYPRESRLLLDHDDEGRFDRSSWLTLLLLGGFHTLGRTKPEQHRGFIEACQHRDWWRVFSDPQPEQRFQEWMFVLDEFIGEQIDAQEYEYWMMRFPVIYKLSRYLDDYVELFLGLDRYSASFKLSTVLSPMVDEKQQGGGISAPALGRSLGIGSNFVVRELLRQKVLVSPMLAEHAFVPYQSVLDLFKDMGCTGLDEYSRSDLAPRLFHFASQHMHSDHVSFGNSWDIPLMIVAQDWSLQEELLGREITDWEALDGE
jgi:hypothetical protein